MESHATTTRGQRGTLGTFPQVHHTIHLPAYPLPTTVMTESNAKAEALVPRFKFERLLNQGMHNQPQNP